MVTRGESTQEQCRLEFLELAKATIKKIDEIDRATPCGDNFNIEPMWWVRMMRIRRVLFYEIDSDKSKLVPKITFMS